MFKNLNVHKYLLLNSPSPADFAQPGERANELFIGSLSSYPGVLYNHQDPNSNLSIIWGYSFLRLSFDLDCTPVQREGSRPCAHEARMMLNFPMAGIWGPTEFQPKAEQHWFSSRDKIKARRELYLLETSVHLSTAPRSLPFNTL